jgi:hypothetical protein
MGQGTGQNDLQGSMGQIRIMLAGRFTSSYESCPGGFATAE